MQMAVKAHMGFDAPNAYHVCNCQCLISRGSITTIIIILIMVIIIIAFQLTMSKVRAGQVLSLQSNLSCASL